MKNLLAIFFFLFAATSANAQSNGGPAYSSGGAGSGVSSFSAGTTGLTPATATTGAVTLGGVLSVANGGTGNATGDISSLTALSGASASTGVILSNLFGAYVNVLSYGAKCDGSTDDSVAVQKAFDNNPSGTVYFPQGQTCNISGPIKLKDATHSFAGQIWAYGSTIVFTNSGNSTDTDANMQHGFQAYPAVNGPGGDTTGLQYVKFSGGIINGPRHGAGIYIANSIGTVVEDTFMDNDRHGSIGLTDKAQDRISRH